MHLSRTATIAIVIIAAGVAGFHALRDTSKAALDFGPRTSTATAAGGSSTSGAANSGPIAASGPGNGAASEAGNGAASEADAAQSRLRDGTDANSVLGSARRVRALRMREDARLVVYVAGEVARPGLYRLPPGARANEALRAAGGATSAGDLVAVNLAEPVVDGQEIAIPARGSSEAESADAAVTYSSASASSTTDNATTPVHHRKRRKHGKHKRRHRSPSASESGPSEDGAGTPSSDASARTSAAAENNRTSDVTESIDVNASSEAELESLPGIGPALAARIVAFRDLNGPFASADELLDVAGMTPGKLEALADLLTFH